MQPTEELRKAMADWVELKKQLAEVRKDVKVLNDQEKKLKAYIKTFMETEKIDLINLKKGKVTLKTNTKRPPLTKKAVEDGLLVYFQGDQVRKEAAMNCIYDNMEEKTSSTITLSGIKD
jgi:hypothetical protein